MDQLISPFCIAGGVIDLQKSFANANPKDPYLIEGRILNSVRDATGEIPIVPEFDWTWFDKSGYFKSEHDPTVSFEVNGQKKVASLYRAGTLVGIPLERNVVGNKEVFIKGRLLPGVDEAEDILKLAKALEEHNKLYPRNTRSLRFSVEGGYLKKSRDGSYAGLVMNVAITPMAQDDSTYLQLAHSTNLQMAKSLAAGTGTSPETKTGGGALRKESLEGSPKNKTQGSTTMDKFSTRQECYRHHLSKGLSPADAKKKADEWANERASARSVSKSAFDTSVQGVIDTLQKSLAAVNAYATGLEAKAPEIVAIDVDMKKSLAVKDAEGDLQADQVFGAVGKGIVGIAALVRDTQLELAKSRVLELQARVEEIGLLKSLAEGVQIALEQCDSIAERQEMVINGLRKSNGSIQFNDLEAVPVAGQQPGQTQDLLKSIPRLAIENFLVDRGIAEKGAGHDGLAQQYFKAQQQFRVTGTAALSKSMIAEIIAAHPGAGTN